MGIFKNKKDMVWKEFAEEMKGQFIEKDGFRPSKVILKNGNWNIVFDTYTVSDGRTNTKYTRVRVPFVKKMDFYMDIHEKGIFKWVEKIITNDNITTGIESIDEQLIIKSNDQKIICSMFKNDKILELMLAQKKFKMFIKRNQGVFGGKFPDHTNELQFKVYGVIKDKKSLKEINGLFCELLNELSNLNVLSKEKTDFEYLS
ncbi:hypothetical protein [Oceanirhabdus sp. W0125-5]|uniref:hypothetical protein n=1 Tax=Oceanirhabdus sp. W0125-5 TaxID=2999116 RepID=UPI0022F2CE90|nr:hypothetical protein [Oceanirhabdus sp. W0125-5]WBW97015.1 hypothetical protein OW730_25490 [Oceanirhabdus sp. W0125-5]